MKSSSVLSGFAYGFGKLIQFNSFFTAQHSGCQIYGQEHIKRDQRIFVNE